MNSIAEWLQSYRRFWEARMARLEAYLRKIQENDSKKGNEHGGERSTGD